MCKKHPKWGGAVMRGLLPHLSPSPFFLLSISTAPHLFCLPSPSPLHFWPPVFNLLPILLVIHMKPHPIYKPLYLHPPKIDSVKKNSKWCLLLHVLYPLSLGVFLATFLMQLVHVWRTEGTKLTDTIGQSDFSKQVFPFNSDFYTQGGGKETNNSVQI